MSALYWALKQMAEKKNKPEGPRLDTTAPMPPVGGKKKPQVSSRGGRYEMTKRQH